MIKSHNAAAEYVMAEASGEADCHDVGNPQDVIYWDALTAYKHIAEHKVTLVDTRPRAEFMRLRIPDACNIPLALIATSAAEHWLRGLRRTSPICVYGMSRHASHEAAKQMKRSGYRNVFCLDQGFMGWQRKGLPCVTEIDGELVRVVMERIGLAAPVVVCG